MLMAATLISHKGHDECTGRIQASITCFHLRPRVKAITPLPAQVELAALFLVAKKKLSNEAKKD